MNRINSEDSVGQEIAVSRWFLVAQERIDSFADITEDWQGIHIDAAIGAKSSFGATIAHGFLVLSLLSAMAADALPVSGDRGVALNYGFDKIRFVSPVRVGARVRGRFQLRDVVTRPNGDRQNRFAATIEIDGEIKPALVADWLTLNRPVKK